MGFFLNPNSESFQRSLRSQIYVDKSLLIQKTNRLIRTEQRYVCVSRPRQFGKTMALDMLAAYYGSGADTRELFQGLKISTDPSFEGHLNHYNVIKINIQRFIGTYMEALLEQLTRSIIDELTEANQNVAFRNKESLAQVMADIYAASGRFFVILIDEWDSPLREKRYSSYEKKLYCDYLRTWLKDQDCVALAYMTGLMPIGRYETFSALDMFGDYSMLNPGDLAAYFGFTRDEAEALCRVGDMDAEEMYKWYGGYDLVSHSIDGAVHHPVFHPKSVLEALMRRKFDVYWNRAEECSALEDFLLCHNSLYSDFAQIGNAIELGNAMNQLLKGGRIEITPVPGGDTPAYQWAKDEWLTLLVHLGYLAYDAKNSSVFIPNEEAARMLADINNTCTIKANAIDPYQPDEPELPRDEIELLLERSILELNDDLPPFDPEDPEMFI